VRRDARVVVTDEAVTELPGDLLEVAELLRRLGAEFEILLKDVGLLLRRPWLGLLDDMPLISLGRIIARLVPFAAWAACTASTDFIVPGRRSMRRRQPLASAGKGSPINAMLSWSIRRLSGRKSPFFGFDAWHSMIWYFANCFPASRLNVIGYIRTQRPVARSTPAQQTVSP
jgi:hypothetical protein